MLGLPARGSTYKENKSDLENEAYNLHRYSFNVKRKQEKETFTLAINLVKIQIIDYKRVLFKSKGFTIFIRLRESGNSSWKKDLLHSHCTPTMRHHTAQKTCQEHCSPTAINSQIRRRRRRNRTLQR